VKAANFLYILATTAALSGYSFWSQKERDHLASPAATEYFIADIRVPLIQTAEAETLWRSSSTVFLDVRPHYDFECGHIPEAINLPDEEFEKLLPALQSRLARAEAIVVYCQSPDCAKSFRSATRLHLNGLSQTKIYPGGWNAWFNSGLPAARTAVR
jgi:rhodanese-related sulfurtransferase